MTNMRPITHKILAILVTVAVLLSGCSVDTSGDRQVGFETGDVINRTNTEYQFESRLSGVAHRTSNRVYRDVHIEFYANESTLIKSISIGSISTGANGTIVTTILPTSPQFVVISSPEFDDDSKLEVFGLKRVCPDRYNSYTITDNQRFPTTTSETVCS